jgi:hypothetical protein
MENNEKKKSKTFVEALEDPTLAHFHEAIKSIQNKPFSQLFPKKHEITLTHVVEHNVGKLFDENPHMPIKMVVATVFAPLTDDIPATLMLKLTKIIIEKWESLSLNSLQEKRTALVA